MRRILLAFVLLFGVGAGTAIAADIPARVVKSPVVAPPPFTWNSCYWGGSVGYNRHKVEWTDEGSWNNGSDQERTMSGAIFGLDTGCNYQTGVFVFGGEADISYSLANKTTGWGTTATTVDMHANWIGTARLRAGIASDRTLFYATGGVAFSNADTFWRDASGTWVWDDWSFGWVYGGGIEHAFASMPNWTIRLEALFIQYKWYNTSGGISSYPIRTRNEDLIVRVGLNYLFATGR